MNRQRWLGFPMKDLVSASRVNSDELLKFQVRAASTQRNEVRREGVIDVASALFVSLHSLKSSCFAAELTEALSGIAEVEAPED